MTVMSRTIAWIAALEIVLALVARALPAHTTVGSRAPLYDSKAGYWSYVAGPLYYAFPRIVEAVTGERGVDKSKLHGDLTIRFEWLADYEYRNATQTKPPAGWGMVRYDIVEAATEMRAWSRDTNILVYDCFRVHDQIYMGEGSKIAVRCSNARATAARDAFIMSGAWLERACLDVNILDPGLCGANAFVNGPAVPGEDECWPRDFSDWLLRNRNVELLGWPDFPSDFKPCGSR